MGAGGRIVNKELQTPTISQPPQGPSHIHSLVQNPEKIIYLALPISQRAPALVSTVLLQSRSDLGTEQGEIIDETLR